MTNLNASVQVLLIENDRADANHLLNLLAEDQSAFSKIGIVWVTNLDAALRELADHIFDAVLFNLELPDSNGIETLRRIRECRQTIPVVVLAASIDNKVAIETMQNGAQDILVKGRATSESLVRVIQYAIERCRADRAVMQLRLMEEREHFIAMLAHKLSIPIVGAQRILSILIETETVPDDVRNLLKQICLSNQTLLRTINNVLDLYRFKNGFDTFVQTDVNVGRLVSDSLHEIVAEAAAKKIRFVKSFSTEDVLYADPLAMRKVMLNLLSNAVKFTPSGGCVTIKFENLSNQSVLSVTDTGIGVEPELLDSIFWQCAEKPRRYQPDGFGIGLDLCRRFVEEQNGNIACLSKVNEGTTIRITLPREPGDQKSTAQSLKQSRNRNLPERSNR